MFESPAPLTQLTVLDAKRRLYDAETWVHEGWSDLAAEAGSDALELAHAHALLVVKPDGLVCGALEPALDHLAGHGLVPAAVRGVELNRHLIRMLWLYKFNIATVERMRIHDAILLSAPSVLVVLRDERREGWASLPASVRLTALKGPSRPERREPWQLRSRLGIGNRLLNLVHTADEPADVVRELAIFLTASDRRALAGELRAGRDRSAAALELGGRIARALGPRDLDLDGALGRVAAAARRHAAGAGDAADREACERLAAICACPGEGSWAALDALVARLGLAVDAWDMIAIGAHLAVHDRPGAGAQTLGDAPPEAWAEFAGEAAGAGTAAAGARATAG